MRKLLIIGGIGILSAAAWTVTADDHGSGSGRGHANPARGGLEHPMRHGGAPSSLIWQFGMGWFSNPEAFPREAIPSPAPSIPEGGLVVVGTEHTVTGHLADLGLHPHTHVTAEPKHGHVLITQPAVPNASGPDQSDAAVGPPNPTANPVHARPPGATGPGRRVFGESGPGVPGPGQPAGLRW